MTAGTKLSALPAASTDAITGVVVVQDGVARIATPQSISAAPLQTMTIAVPSAQFPTLGSVLSWLAPLRIADGATVTIIVTGFTLETGVLSINHVDGDSIFVVGTPDWSGINGTGNGQTGLTQIPAPGIPGAIAWTGTGCNVNVTFTGWSGQLPTLGMFLFLGYASSPSTGETLPQATGTFPIVAVTQSGTTVTVTVPIQSVTAALPDDAQTSSGQTWIVPSGCLLSVEAVNAIQTNGVHTAFLNGTQGPGNISFSNLAFAAQPTDGMGNAVPPDAPGAVWGRGYPIVGLSLQGGCGVMLGQSATAQGAVCLYGFGLAVQVGTGGTVYGWYLGTGGSSYTALMTDDCANVSLFGSVINGGTVNVVGGNVAMWFTLFTPYVGYALEPCSSGQSTNASQPLIIASEGALLELSFSSAPPPGVALDVQGGARAIVSGTQGIVPQTNINGGISVAPLQVLTNPITNVSFVQDGVSNLPALIPSTNTDAITGSLVMQDGILKVGPPPSGVILSGNITYDIPGDFATVNAALAHIAAATVTPNTFFNLCMSGAFSVPANTSLNAGFESADFSHVSITTPASQTYWVSLLDGPFMSDGVTRGVDGSPGSWLATFTTNGDYSSLLAAGQFLEIWQSENWVADQLSYYGYWQIAAITPSTVQLIINSVRQPPTAGFGAGAAWSVPATITLAPNATGISLTGGGKFGNISGVVFAGAGASSYTPALNLAGFCSLGDPTGAGFGINGCAYAINLSGGSTLGSPVSISGNGNGITTDSLSVVSGQVISTGNGIGIWGTGGNIDIKNFISAMNSYADVMLQFGVNCNLYGATIVAGAEYSGWASVGSTINLMSPTLIGDCNWSPAPGTIGNNGSTINIW